MAVVVQANLVQLKVLDARRRGIAADEHELSVKSPGAVVRFREALLDPHVLAGYSDAELQLRLHEVWGQYCLLGWALHRVEPESMVNFGAPSSGPELRCDAHLASKHDEIHALLWRMRIEHELRAGGDGSSSNLLRNTNTKEQADRIPALVHGKPVSQCTDDELLAVSCEHAGMLASLRWVMDCERTWGDSSLMNVGEHPF
jgi:hypothetical protein